MEVQRQWCSLEAIFIGSEDIREQLPEDAKRFDSIDAEFREQARNSGAILAQFWRSSLTPRRLRARRASTRRR